MRLINNDPIIQLINNHLSGTLPITAMWHNDIGFQNYSKLFFMLVKTLIQNFGSQV